MADLKLQGIHKAFGGVRVLHEIDIALPDGEFLVLVGPSGCGKSTLMNLVAGLEEPSGGRIVLGGRDITDVEPADRNISMVFQSYALYPNMTVAQNIAFPLEMRGVPEADRQKTVKEVSSMLQIEHLLERKPRQLSGGQRQRVAIGRALARHPQLFLFDEPLSNLDAKLRVDMRAEIKRLHMRTGVTTIYVTHDQVEAMTLGTRIAVLKDGLIQQLATPLELYSRPANRFVAEFIGSPSINCFEAVREASGTLRLADGQVIGSAAGATGDKLIVGVRPEDLSMRPANDENALLKGTVSLVEPTGPETYALVDLGVGEATVRMGGLPSVEPGQAVRVHVPPGALHLFDPASGKRLN
ncbi:ABC transporter ATP-binding protein [Piscinibacter defluvii]|uniref:ABC transporter ATP-binding protein n=1 Tax=Piscinibacter defluvii TaxID=1796922 RepID=UPI000FDF4CCE|nr:ABC transporter ATP-binding protein [Piscinibacter defluvii]